MAVQDLSDSGMTIQSAVSKSSEQTAEKLRDELGKMSTYEELHHFALGCPHFLLPDVARQAVRLGLPESNLRVVGRLLYTLGRRTHTLGKKTHTEDHLALRRVTGEFISEVSRTASRGEALDLASGAAEFNVCFEDMEPVLKRLNELYLGSLSSATDEELACLAGVFRDLFFQGKSEISFALADEIVSTVRNRWQSIRADRLLEIVYSLNAFRPSTADKDMINNLGSRLAPFVAGFGWLEMKRFADVFLERRLPVKEVKILPVFRQRLQEVFPTVSLPICRVLKYCFYFESSGIDEGFLAEVHVAVQRQLVDWPVRALSELAFLAYKTKAHSGEYDLLHACAEAALAKGYSLLDDENCNSSLLIVGAVLALNKRSDVVDKLLALLKGSVSSLSMYTAISFFKRMRPEKQYHPFVRVLLNAKCEPLDLNDDLALILVQRLIRLRISRSKFIRALVDYTSRDFDRILAECPQLVRDLAHLAARSGHCFEPFMMRVAQTMDARSGERVDKSTILLAWCCAVCGIYPQEALSAVFSMPFEEVKELCSKEETCAARLLLLHWHLRSTKVVSQLGLSADVLLFLQGCVTNDVSTVVKPKSSWLRRFTFASEHVGILTKEGIVVSFPLLWQLPTATQSGCWISWQNACLDPTNVHPAVLAKKGLVPFAVRVVSDSLFAFDVNKPLAFERLQQQLLQASGWLLITVKRSAIEEHEDIRKFLRKLVERAKQDLMHRTLKKSRCS